MPGSGGEAKALYFAPVTLTTTAATGQMPVTLGSLQQGAGGDIYDARVVRIDVVNGADQAITGLTLLTQDVVGGASIATSYAVSGVNVAAASPGQPVTGTFVVDLTTPPLANLLAVVTFAAAPTAGKTVTLKATVAGPGSNRSALVGSNALYAGQNATVTTTAAALGSSQACSEVNVQADPRNTVNVLVGSSSAQYTVLQPGVSMDISVNNVNLVYVKAASGTADQTVNWLARS